MKEFKVGDKVRLRGTYILVTENYASNTPDFKDGNFENWALKYGKKKGQIVTITSVNKRQGQPCYWIDNIQAGAFSQNNFIPPNDELTTVKQSIKW